MIEADSRFADDDNVPAVQQYAKTMLFVPKAVKAEADVGEPLAEARAIVREFPLAVVTGGGFASSRQPSWPEGTAVSLIT